MGCMHLLGPFFSFQKSCHGPKLVIHLLFTINRWLLKVDFDELLSCISLISPNTFIQMSSSSTFSSCPENRTTIVNRSVWKSSMDHFWLYVWKRNDIPWMLKLLIFLFFTYSGGHTNTQETPISDLEFGPRTKIIPK